MTTQPINKTPANKWGEPIKRDLSGVERLRKERGVKTFADFPESTKVVYLAVAKCFPGVQVYACGSRVRGDYAGFCDHPGVYCARQAAGMKYKQESDYDFFIYGKPAPICELPPNTEQVRARVPESELIEIPIYGMGLEQTT